MKQETVDMILKFRDDRNWKQFHNPKDLAISISLEAAPTLSAATSLTKLRKSLRMSLTMPCLWQTPAGLTLTK